MDYTSVIRLMLLTKALKYKELCDKSVENSIALLGRNDCLTNIDSYRELCYETEKAKLYNEFSDELRELADRIGARKENDGTEG